MKSFNELSPAEAERLALLAEECAEVIQMVGKILRHGYASHHPDGGPTNAILLADELGHVLAVKDIMSEACDIDALQMSRSEDAKLAGYRARKYLHHQ